MFPKSSFKLEELEQSSTEILYNLQNYVREHVTVAKCS